MRLTGRYQKYGLVDNACSFYLKQEAGCACGFFRVRCAAFFFFSREQPGTTSYRQQHCSTTNWVRLCPLNELDFGMQKTTCVYKRSMFGCTHCLGEGFVLVTSSISLCVCPTWRFPWLWTRLSWPQRAFVRPWFNPMAMLSLSLSSAGLEGKLVLPPEKKRPWLHCSAA